MERRSDRPRTTRPAMRAVASASASAATGRAPFLPFLTLAGWGERASSAPRSTHSSCSTTTSAPSGRAYSSRYSSLLTTLMRRLPPSRAISAVPSISEMRAPPLGTLASNNSSTRGRPEVMSKPATPPVWKVRMVSWVPGSPMLCAATMPTASPTLTTSPRARLRP